MTLRLRFVVALFLALVLFGLCGCASIAPIGMFPREQGTRAAEGVWLSLHTVDTLQTVQIARNPQCFYEADPLAVGIYGSQHPNESRVLLTNVVLGAIHPVVSRWFDEHVEQSYNDDTETANLWAMGRIGWHAISIIGTGVSVANNFRRGIGPFSTRCP
jgi:hypothetical protein